MSMNRTNMYIVRYMSILHPLRTAIPRDNVCYVIWAIWLVAGLASIPEPFFTLHGTEDEFERRNGKLICRYKHCNVLKFIIVHNLYQVYVVSQNQILSKLAQHSIQHLALRSQTLTRKSVRYILQHTERKIHHRTLPPNDKKISSVLQVCI